MQIFFEKKTQQKFVRNKFTYKLTQIMKIIYAEIICKNLQEYKIYYRSGKFIQNDDS